MSAASRGGAAPCCQPPPDPSPEGYSRGAQLVRQKFTHFCRIQWTKLMDETNTGIELSISGQSLFRSRHLKQHEAYSGSRTKRAARCGKAQATLHAILLFSSRFRFSVGHADSLVSTNCAISNRFACRFFPSCEHDRKQVKERKQLWRHQYLTVQIRRHSRNDPC